MDLEGARGGGGGGGGAPIPSCRKFNSFFNVELLPKSVALKISQMCTPAVFKSYIRH